MEPTNAEPSVRETELPLGQDFPAASREDWLKLVSAVLRGAPFATLIAKTYDELAMEIGRAHV